MRLIVSGTSTDVGKTCVGRGLAAAWHRQGWRTAALKPMETGVGPAGPVDALGLRRAAGAAVDGEPVFYRAAEPLSPLAVQIETGVAPPVLGDLAFHVKRLAAGADRVLVEGAGGVLVPVGPGSTTLDFFCEVGWPILLVARDRLGVQSDVLACLAQLRLTGLRLAAVCLTAFPGDGCRSSESNAQVLKTMHPGLPFVRLAFDGFDDLACERAVQASGLLALLEAH